MANCVPLVLGQLNRIKSQALGFQRLSSACRKSLFSPLSQFSMAQDTLLGFPAHTLPFRCGESTSLSTASSQALENQRLTFTMFAMFLFIRQSFRYSGFQSSSSKLLIYTSQKERISFSSPAKKLS